MPEQRAEQPDLSKQKERLTSEKQEADMVRQERILKERAIALAREPEKIAAPEDHLVLVEFMLAHEHYGIETGYVEEVYPLKDYHPVPCTPDFVVGIINVRGHIVSIINLKKFFDLPEKGLSHLNKIIILHHGEMRFAIMADAIIGVRTIALSEIQPSLPTFTDIRAEYLLGVSRESMVILHGRKILKDRNIVLNEEVASRSGGPAVLIREDETA